MTPTGAAFYDRDTATLWVARRLAPRTRVDRQEVLSWVALRKRGHTDDGDPVKAVNVLFLDEASAAYNYQTLAFVDLGCFYESGGNRVRYLPPDGELEVDVRVDFGIVMPGDDAPKD